MEIIGNGFLAHHLRPLAGAHREATVLVAGVSGVTKVVDEECQREASLLYDVLHRCRKDSRTLIVFSTASVYGQQGHPAAEDGPVYPASAYSRHKLALEAIVQRSRVRHLILRLSSIAGPGEREHHLLPSLHHQVRSGAAEIRRGARRDLIDVGDVITIVDELLGRGIAQEVVNVASGFSVPVEAIIDHLEARLGVVVERRYVGESEAIAVSIEKLRHLMPAISRLGFGPDYYKTVVDRYLAGAPAPVITSFS
jgi:nucleoside-diphosphate-sugar epimerase